MCQLCWSYQDTCLSDCLGSHTVCCERTLCVLTSLSSLIKCSRWRKAVALWQKGWWNCKFAVFAGWECLIWRDVVNFTYAAPQRCRVTVLRGGKTGIDSRMYKKAGLGYILDHWRSLFVFSSCFDAVWFNHSIDHAVKAVGSAQKRCDCTSPVSYRSRTALGALFYCVLNSKWRENSKAQRIIKHREKFQLPTWNNGGNVSKIGELYSHFSRFLFLSKANFPHGMTYLNWFKPLIYIISQELWRHIHLGLYFSLWNRRNLNCFFCHRASNRIQRVQSSTECTCRVSIPIFRIHGV